MNWTIQTLRNISWDELERAQKHLVASVHGDPQRGFLLVSEPRATYTHGRSSQPGDLLGTRPDIAVAEVSRGGQWTYHGPGQIVVYPIVRLESLGYGLREISRFCNDLRDAVTAFLRAKGVACESGDEPFGIFNDGKKLASFGLSAHRGIVNHGLALYLTPQSEAFRGINPCGVAAAPVVSIEELGVRMSWEDAAGQLGDFIKNAFKTA